MEIVLTLKEAKNIDALCDGNDGLEAGQGAFYRAPDADPLAKETRYVVDATDRSDFESFRAAYSREYGEIVDMYDRSRKQPAALGKFVDFYDMLNSFAAKPATSLVGEPVVFALLGSPAYPPTSLPNAVPYDWIRRYFEQKASDKDPLFLDSFDGLRKIAALAGQDGLVTWAELSALVADGGKEKTFYERLIAHFRDETLYARAQVILDDRTGFLTLFVDPDSRFVSAEFATPEARNDVCLPRLVLATGETAAELSVLTGRSSGPACDNAMSSDLPVADALKSLSDIAAYFAAQSDEDAGETIRYATDTLVAQLP